MRASKTKLALKRAELSLEKKRKELIKAKRLHQKLAGEFIDLWMITRRLQKQTTSKP